MLVLLGCFFFFDFGFVVLIYVRFDDGGLEFLFLPIWRQVIFRFGNSTLGSGRKTLKFRVILAKRRARQKGKKNSYVNYLWHLE